MEENRTTDRPRLMRHVERAFEALARRNFVSKLRELRSGVPSAAGFRAQVDAAVACDNASGEATARVSLAVVLQSQQNPTALAEFETALQACRRTGNPRSEAELLLHFIPVFLERQDRDRALTLADRAVEITAHSRLDHHMLSLFELGRVWLEGFQDLKKGRAALRQAADVFEQARAHHNPAAAKIAHTLAAAILQAAEAALKTGDSDLVLRLVAMTDRNASQHLAEKASVAPASSLSPSEFRAVTEEGNDEFTARRTTQTEEGLAHLELLFPAPPAAAQTLTQPNADEHVAEKATVAPPSSLSPSEPEVSTQQGNNEPLVVGRTTVTENGIATAELSPSAPPEAAETLAEPDAGQHLVEEKVVALTPSLSLAELRACAEEKYDAWLAVWRTTRTRGRTAHPELLPPALHAAAETLVKSFAWDDARALTAEPSQEINFVSTTRGGPAGILRLSEQMAAGQVARDEALQLAVLLGVGDDDLAFLIAVPGGAPERGPRVLGGLLELVGTVAQDNQFAARCLRMLSTFTARDGKSDETWRLLDQAAARLAGGADPALRAEVLNEQAVGLFHRGSLMEGLVKGHEARALALDCGAASIARMALGTVGQLLLALDCAAEALETFKQLEAEQEAAGESTELDATRSRMEMARRRLEPVNSPALPEASSDPDHIDKGLSAFEQAATTAPSTSDQMALAEASLSAGQAEEALSVFDSMGAAAEDADPRGRVAAPRSFEAAQTRERALSSIDAEAAAAFGLGNVAASELKTTEAQSHYREAAGLAGQTNNSRLEAVSLDSLALLYLRQRDPARAIDLQIRAAELYRKLCDWNGHVTNLVNLISSYVLLREADHAAATLREAKAIVQKHRLSHLRPLLQLKAAQIDALRGNWPLARKSYRAGLRQIEAEGAQSSTPAAQRQWDSRRMEAFSLAVEDAILAGDASAALEFLEANRTRVFEAIHLRRGIRPSDVPEVVMRQYELATSQLDELQRQQRASMGRPDSTLECALAEAHASCEALRSLVETADKAPPAPSASKFPAFKSLVRAIPRGHVVISINILNRGTAVVCVGRTDAGKVWTSTRLESALDGAHLQELVLGDLEAWRRASSPDDIPDAALGWAAVNRNKAPELWQRTLRHVVKELGARLWPMIESAVEGRTRRLILMPGAGFAVLPLHAGLLANGMRAQDCYEIRYAPSLSLFQRASRLAPVRLPHSLGQLIPLSPDLPFAALQAARVRRHLGGTHQARVEGLKATPDEALALLASPGIFHFTGNGAFNSNQPLRSELVCAGEGGDGQGLLTVRMMLERAEQLRCNLAILPGCESGRVEPADLMNDSLGLPGALLAAGCGGVLATFWPVRDLVASLVLDHTLETWRAGSVTLPGALARATRWLRDATTEKVCERLAVWREDNPEFAPLLDATMDELRQRARAQPFAHETEWAAFHLVGNPELPRKP